MTNFKPGGCEGKRKLMQLQTIVELKVEEYLLAMTVVRLSHCQSQYASSFDSTIYK